MKFLNHEKNTGMLNNTHVFFSIPTHEFFCVYDFGIHT